MSKFYFSLIFSVLCTGLINAQIVITEIMYNPPESGQDSLEYIEIFNQGDQAVDLEGYNFTQGIVYTFPAIQLASKEYLVVCVDSVAMETIFGITEALQWESGGLSNGGEDIIIEDAQGNQVDLVDYQNGGDWPSDANGEGASLELCDPLRDNNDGTNWKASASPKGTVINDRELRATPDAENQVSCADHTVMVMNNFFSPDSLTINVGETVEWIAVEGFHNVNGTTAQYPSNPEGFGNGPARPAPWAYDFTFSQEGSYDYQCDPHVLLGMRGHIQVIQNTLPEIVITEIMYNNPGSDTLEFVELYNNSDEEVAMDGFRFINGITYDFTTEVMAPRSYLVLAAFPDYLQNELGISALEYTGSLNNDGEAIELIDEQGRTIDRVVYDDGSPWNALSDGMGYSLILCDVDSDNGSGTNWDISQNNTGLVLDGMAIFCNPGMDDECDDRGPQYPLYDIAVVTTVDGLGFPDSIQVTCALQGIVHGVDLQGNDNIQFTLIDPSGGISIFSENDFNYTVNEGDELLVKGRIDQFNGLSQMYLDSLRVIGTGGASVPAVDVTVLDESTESEIVRLRAVSLLNPGQWEGDGMSFNVDVTDGTNIYNVRIDNDTELSSAAAPTGQFNLSGIGGQFDSREPYDEGYQLLPRYQQDIDPINSAEDQILQGVTLKGTVIDQEIVWLNKPIDAMTTVVNASGKLMATSNNNNILITDWPSGTYYLTLSMGSAQRTFKVVKI